MVCNGCSGTEFRHLAVRGDGAGIQQCVVCGLGVLVRPSADPQAYRGDLRESTEVLAGPDRQWAAALARLLLPEGAVLDIGCLDGDLLDPALRERHRASFDATTAVAVFEYLPDFRGGFEAAMFMLKQDGFLLFEVPLISTKSDDEAWLQGSSEQIYYPTEASIRQIVEHALGCHLVGAEFVIPDQASAYVGVVTKTPAQLSRIQAVFDCLLPVARLRSRNAETLGETGRPGKPDALSETHRALEQARQAASFEARRSAAAAIEAGELRNRLAQATSRLDAIEGSALWRSTGPLRHVGARFPRLARRTSQLAKLVWWTANGTLMAHVREYRHRRAVAEAARGGLPARYPEVSLLVETSIVPSPAPPPEDEPWPADRPLVSVVIPCFNYGHLIEEAIRSVESQTFTDIEIIVVEGGSTSAESRELLLEVTRKHASERLTVLMQDKPHRAGANRNFGISHARGKYICCLDADDRLAPTYIEKAVFLLETVGYDVVSPALQFFGNKLDVWAPDARPTLDKLLIGNQVLTCALFRRTLWSTAGGYRDSDPSTGHVHEDWLFWVRLAALGARFINIPEPLFHYRSHGNTLSNSDAVLELDAQNYQVRRFNSDVLTEEAMAAARRRSDVPQRLPQSYRQWQRSQFAIRSAGPTLLLALPFLVLGGAERLLSALVGHLAARGWRVILVTTVPVDALHGDTTLWFEASTAEIFQLPRFLGVEHWKDFIDHLFASRDIQLLWVVGSAFMYDHTPALKLRHPKLRVADLLFNTVGHTANNRRYADCIDMTFVENTEVRDWLLAAGERADGIELIESGVDLIENAPTASREEALASAGLSGAGTVVGFFGRWSEEKDPLGFVEIAKRIPAELPVTFVMTGAGPLEGALRDAIDAAGFAPGRFHLKGAVPDVKPYLRACDILVLPSRLDGRPNVIMEALATGVAIVASRVGALPEMFDDTQQGYLCAAGDYECFAERIVGLASNGEVLARFKVAARELAEERLDIRVMLQAYERRLRKLAAT
ncbi:MAG: glycosyltransferase [Variovorax sp.]|nr:MAG: glycosyltransferase [Variovorax sp.]